MTQAKCPGVQSKAAGICVMPGLARLSALQLAPDRPRPGRPRPPWAHRHCQREICRPRPVELRRPSHSELQISAAPRLLVGASPAVPAAAFAGSQALLLCQLSELEAASPARP